MKPTAIIVNTARGEVIDENALVRMLKAGELAGAGLDVYEHEPQVNPKLLELERVVLLPHMGSATLEGRIDMGEKVLINIKTFADGHKPPDRVWRPCSRAQAFFYSSAADLIIMSGAGLPALKAKTASPRVFFFLPFLLLREAGPALPA